MKPLVGTPVQYTGAGTPKFPPEVYAAIITKVREDGSCDLHIFCPGGVQYDKPSVPYTLCRAGTEGAVGCWSFVFPPKELK